MSIFKQFGIPTYGSETSSAPHRAKRPTAIPPQNAPRPNARCVSCSKCNRTDRIVDSKELGLQTDDSYTVMIHDHACSMHPHRKGADYTSPTGGTKFGCGEGDRVEIGTCSTCKHATSIEFICEPRVKPKRSTGLIIRRVFYICHCRPDGVLRSAYISCDKYEGDVK